MNTTNVVFLCIAKLLSFDFNTCRNPLLRLAFSGLQNIRTAFFGLFSAVFYCCRCILYGSIGREAMHRIPFRLISPFPSRLFF